MNKRSWLGIMAGLTLGALAVAGWRLYRRRSTERIPSQEGIDDPAAARAYGRIMRLPHMALLRSFVARRATKLATAGVAADLGCGPGYLAVELAHRAPGLHVTGVDLSDAMLTQAIANAPAGGRGASDGLPHRRRRRAALSRCFPGPGGEHSVAASLGRPSTHLRRSSRCVLRPGGAFLLFDLRRDLGPAPWLLLWFVTHVIVPSALRHIGEPLGSRNAAYTPEEAAGLLQISRLTGWRVARGPFWLSIEGYTV